MQALILAGGEGTRLRPLTTTVPKPVLPLANRPFISYMVDWLAHHGFDDVVMSCGFLAGGVRAVLGDGSRDGIRIRYVEEPSPLGTAGAVKFAEEVLEERFAVLNGDVLTDFDLGALWRFHDEHDASATVALIEVPDPSAYGLVLLDSDGRVSEFLEKPEPGASAGPALINAGAYVLEHDVLGPVAEDRPVSFEREVFPALVGRGLFGCRIEGYWLDIGTPERYLEATRDILEGRLGRAIAGDVTGAAPPGVEAAVAAGAKLRRPVLLGGGCEVADGAMLGPVAVLGEGCVVGERAEIENAVLHAHVQVAEDAVVRDSIVGSGAVVGAGSRLEQYSIVGEQAVVPPGAALSGARVEPPAAPTSA